MNNLKFLLLIGNETHGHSPQPNHQPPPTTTISFNGLQKFQAQSCIYGNNNKSNIECEGKKTVVWENN